MTVLVFEVQSQSAGEWVGGRIGSLSVGVWEGMKIAANEHAQRTRVMISGHGACAV